MKTTLPALTALMMLAAIGCDALIPTTSAPTTLTITFVSEIPTQDVDIDFFSNSDGSVTREVLTDPEASDHLAFSALANESYRYLQACTQFRAAIIANATLVTGTDNSPMASTDILLDGMDFECGNFITFTLTSSGPDNLEINVTIGDEDPLPGAEDAAAGVDPAAEGAPGDAGLDGAEERTGEAKEVAPQPPDADSKQGTKTIPE